MFNGLISGPNTIPRQRVPSDSLAYEGSKQEFPAAEELAYHGSGGVLSDISPQLNSRRCCQATPGDW
jgi:hypothetical protein